MAISVIHIGPAASQEARERVNRKGIMMIPASAKYFTAVLDLLAVSPRPNKMAIKKTR